jgi:hypothetical protein
LSATWGPAQMVTRKRRGPVRLARLRKAVSLNSRVYGLLVQAFDALRGEHIALQNRVQHLEKLTGLRWSARQGGYLCER